MQFDIFFAGAPYVRVEPPWLLRVEDSTKTDTDACDSQQLVQCQAFTQQSFSQTSTSLYLMTGAAEVPHRLVTISTDPCP